jgi:hypothetical protein
MMGSCTASAYLTELFFDIDELLREICHRIVPDFLHGPFKMIGDPALIANIINPSDGTGNCSGGVAVSADGNDIPDGVFKIL